MAETLVLLTGASSGIGLALAKAVPFEDARIIGIGRRGAEDCEHCAADLADPASWRRVAQLFMREIQSFTGDRVVFIHCAGGVVGRHCHSQSALADAVEDGW